MLLSVIIPIYNAKRFLRETVESVINQNFEGLEIILVDDGSDDGSAELCNTLVSQYDLISVIHKSNGGVSSARNAGIEAAKGKFITFIDADDKIANGMFSDLLEEAETFDADKVFCGFKEIAVNGHNAIHIPDIPARCLLDRKFIISSMLYSGCSGDSYMNTACGSLYKSELLRKNNIRFKDRSIGEDWMFNMQYCESIKSAVFVNEPYYLYMRNNESAVSRYHNRQFEFWLENRAYRKELAQKYGFDISQKITDTEWVAKVLFYSLQVIKNESKNDKILRSIFNHKEFTKALGNIESIRPKFFLPVIALLKNNHFRMALLLLRMYSFRIN